jgi:hypothetical protein
MAKKKGPIPPCPGNPEDYVLVNSKEGPYWRRKRGTVKTATLNTAFKNNVKLTKIISPVAVTIRKKLEPFLEGLDTGRFLANVSGLLKKEYYKSGKLDFLALKDYELQPSHHLQTLLRRTYEVHIKKNEIIIEIPLGENVVKKVNKQMTGYHFELILLYGDLTKQNTLRSDSDTSSVYDMQLKTGTRCRLSLILPSKKVSWMALLKLTCTFGNKPASHRSHYGMRVVWAEKN